ncbi:MAG: GNAT family N-acetyltransferase [Acidobacteriota bacterium]
MMHTIRSASEEDIPGIVSVHLASFQKFFLSCLGPRFLSLLYHEIMKQEGSLSLAAADEEGKVVGFAVGVANQASLYRRLAVHRWFAFAMAGSRAALAHPMIIPRLFQAFAYVGKSRAAACPALLMSIAVAPEGKGRGIGSDLVARFLDEMAERGVDKVSLTTDRDDNEATNGFYRKLGFSMVREYQTPQGRWMNEYVIQTKGERS